MSKGAGDHPDSEDADSPNKGIISSVQSQLVSLRNRVEELEAENAKLSSQVSSCCCHKIGESKSRELKAVGDKPTKKAPREKKPVTGNSTRSMNHHSKRYVALKVMYFGQRFYGFASQAQMDPTVESEIFKALEKTRLLIGEKEELQYSRCGRTDKGVSSVGQVIALFLRSNLTEAGAKDKNSLEIVAEDKYGEEIDYVKVLNRVLPNDIRVVGWCPAPTGFSARFSCLSREYKYFFWRDNLNLLAMECAAKKFVGEHDFRNFCKMDAMNVHNFRRHISSFEISSCNKSCEGNQLWAMSIKGSAFLWHQVRCMVAVLFMIGRDLEPFDMVDTLLDTDRTPRKPQYPMAPEMPLVLRSCEFEGLKFICSSEAGQALRAHLENEYRTYQLQAAIFHEALLFCSPSVNDEDSSDNGVIKKAASHIPLMSRPTEPSYAERRAKIDLRTRKEFAEFEKSQKGE